MTNNNKAKPDPKTTSNATRVNDPVAPNPEYMSNGQTHPSTGIAQPDPKTVSNATRVNEAVAPNPSANTPAPVANNDWNPHGNPVSKKTNELDPSSDQPDEIARKAKEEQSQKVETSKKIVKEGGDKDVSHATIGKDEEKDAKKSNSDSHKSSHHKKNDSKTTQKEEKTVVHKEEKKTEKK